MTTSIQKDALLSQLSALAYKDATFLSDSANLPNSWSMKLADERPPFAAFAFKNETTGEVVIAYRDTDGLGDRSGDAAILAGSWDPQFQQDSPGNPLVADAAKGLHSLVTWDVNGDGKITAVDPIYRQLKVWQDYNQDANNTSTFSVNTANGVQPYQVQDESNGIKALRGLAELGITAIDYGNGRYEIGGESGSIDEGCRSISTAHLRTNPTANDEFWEIAA